MKLEYESYPLSIYDQELSKSLLKSLDSDISKSPNDNSSIGQSVLSKYISKAAGTGLLSLIDDVSIGLKEEQARKCLSNLTKKQVIRIKRTPSSIINEAQINLMATYCVTEYLSSLECESWGNGAKNIAKVVIGLFKGRNPLEVVWDSVNEISDNYNNICQIYYIAFLLNVYKSSPQLEKIITQLITESLGSESPEGSVCMLSKERLVLFSNFKEKTLGENLKIRLNMVSNYPEMNIDLFNIFIKHQEKKNAENI